MKKIYVLIILLVSGFGFGQAKATYTVEFKNLDYRVYRNVKNKTSSHFDLTLKYTDGTTTKLYGAGIGDGSSISDYSMNAFTTEKIPKSINYDLFVNFSNTSNIGDNFDISTYPCITAKSFSKAYDGMDVSFEYDIKPNLQIIQTAYDLPTDKFITIASIPGFNRSYYNWQYSLNPTPDPSSWINLPQYNGKSSITTNASEILKTDASSYHGKKIYFRQKACSTASLPAEYTIRKSAPNIASYLLSETNCFDTNDGKLKLTFDRPLISNVEKFTCSIKDFDEETQAYKEVVYSTQEIEGIEFDNNNSYLIPKDFPKGKYALTFIGTINGISTSPPTDIQPFLFEITSPAPVDFSITKINNIRCFGGKDSEIEITASGGTNNGIYQYSINQGVTWMSFNNGNKQLFSGLSIGDYSFEVRKVKDINDNVGCIAKENDNIKIITKTISQPTSPLTLIYTFKKDPTFYKGVNGKIVAAISGGTINDNNTYLYEWKNSNGVVLPATAQYNSADKTYNITLENVPAGEYKLTVKDKNYNTATNKEGCSIIESSQILTQPDQIIITLAETQAISCNTENSESDVNKFSDGILKATVSGGIKFTGSANNGLPYMFIWSKYNTATNLWEELADYKTDTAENLSKGNYSLNITDANGIVQGTYNTTDLVTAIPTTKEMTEPAKLELSFTSGNVSCHEGNNGWATATVTGGTGSYTYIWYNTGNGIIDQNKIAQLTAGEYTVEVTDDKGCFIKG
ncbi:MAG: SprB repeat-containing protein, partial [Flavobacterium sp.]